jgi:hypothetical protein
MSALDTKESKKRRYVVTSANIVPTYFFSGISVTTVYRSSGKYCLKTA